MNLSLFLTGRCQFSCDYCYVDKLLDGNDMSTDTALLAIDKFAKHVDDDKKKLFVLLAGGEPLIVWDTVKSILEFGSKINPNPRFFLTTNGIALTEEIISDLVKHKVSVALSIDGSEECHMKHRKPKISKIKYSTLISKAKILLDNMEWCEARMTVTPDIVHKLYDNIVFLNKLGFKNIRFGLDYFSHNWSMSHFDNYEKQLALILNHYNPGVDGLSCITLDGKLESLRNKKKYIACAFDSYQIMPNGVVYPCSHFRNIIDYSIGNVREINIEKYELNCNLKKVLGKLPVQCEKCGIKNHCLGARCLVANYICNGDFLKPLDSVCSLEKITYNALLKYHRNSCN